MQHVNEQLNILSLFIQKNQDFYEKKFKKQEQDFQQKYNKLKDKINTLFNR